jgi:O-antigen ligase
VGAGLTGRWIESPLAQIVAAALGAALLAALYVASAYKFGPFLLPTALVVGCLVVVAIARPVWGLTAAMLVVPLETIELPLPSGALSPSETALGIVALGWVLRAAYRPGAVSWPGVRDAPLLVLLLVMFVGITFVELPEPVVRVVLLWTVFFLVYLQARSLTPSEVRIVLIGMTVSVGVLGVIGALAFLRSGSTTQLFAGGLRTGTRATGSFVDANYYASFLLLGMLPAVTLILRRFRSDGWLLIPLAGAVAGLLFSLSRGGIAAFAFGLVVLLAWSRARRIVLVLVPVLAVTTLAGATPFTRSDQLDVVTKRLGTLNQSLGRVDMRPRIWATAVDLIEERPLLGVGLRQFYLAAGTHGLYERGEPVENVHNTPLDIAAETGVIGGFAFLVFIGQLLWRALHAIASRDSLIGPLALGLGAALLAFLLQGLTQSQLRVNVVAGSFFVVAGLITALSDHASRFSSSDAGGAPKMAT